jgi:glycosyltransferase involved in cell wall biosynthesis
VKFLEPLVHELDRLRNRLQEEGCPLILCEAIFVDDSSTDGSATLLESLEARYPWVKIVSLSRNYGQHPATVAGILHSSGDWVATLDEDLQHRPDHIVALLSRAVEDSRDLVYATPHGAVHGSRFRDGSSRWYKWFISWLAGNLHVRSFNSFRLIRGTVARAAASVVSRETYLDMALCWFTDRIATVPLALREVRDATGRSGYSLRSLLRHARRMLVSSQIKPLRAGGLIGIASLLLSIVGAAALLVVKLSRPELIQVRGWTSLILTLFFFGGLTSFLLAIAIEFLSDLHLQALGRPTFFVVDRSGDRAVAAWFRENR